MMRFFQSVHHIFRIFPTGHCAISLFCTDIFPATIRQIFVFDIDVTGTHVSVDPFFHPFETGSMLLKMKSTKTVCGKFAVDKCTPNGFPFCFRPGGEVTAHIQINRVAGFGVDPQHFQRNSGFHVPACFIFGTNGDPFAFFIVQRLFHFAGQFVVKSNLRTIRTETQEHVRAVLPGAFPVISMGENKIDPICILLNQFRVGFPHGRTKI